MEVVFLEETFHLTYRKNMIIRTLMMIIKTMWRNLGANLEEHNAERTAGTLESRQLVYKSIDHDCDLTEHHFTRDKKRLFTRSSMTC